MNWRLFGLGFVYVACLACVAPHFAMDVAADDENCGKSPLNETGDPSVVSSIDRMKRRLTEGLVTDRILLSLKAIEVEPQQLTEFIPPTFSLYELKWAAWFDREPRKVTDTLTWHGLWNADELQQLTHHPDAPSWTSPPLTLVVGRETKYHFGGSIPVRRMTDDGVSYPSNETYGRSIVATATISNLNRIHLVVANEVSDQTTSNEVASSGNSRRIDAAFELNHGETRVFGRKVVSTSGRESYQLMQATAWLKPFEIPLDPETIPVSAVEELSTPEKDVAEFNATRAARSDIATQIDKTSVSVASSQPVNQVADDSVFARQMRRIDGNEVADEVRLSVVVTEVTLAEFGKDFRPYRSYPGYYTWEPNLFSTFPCDVVEVETTGDPSASHVQSTDLFRAASGIRAFRPDHWTMHTKAKTWKLPAALAESGKTILWRAGGEVPVVRLDPYRRESIANEQFGVTVTATPTITDLDETQVHFDIALKDLVQSTNSLRVESARRMRTTIRVRNGEIVSFGQPAVSDTGRESFLTVSVTASIAPPIHDPIGKDFETTSALLTENSNSMRNTAPVNADFATLFGVGQHQGCWADSTMPNLQKINNNLDALERNRFLQPDAEVARLSYRLSHPFDESSPLFTDP
jgi:Flp pilus assembly secretin CpaC